jgi:uncharacterized protein (TIGR02588 family)
VSTQEHPSGPAAGAAPPFWEWVVAGIGLVLVLAVLGYLVLDAFHSPDTPPAPEVQVLGVEAQAGRFLVRFSARNGGSRTAEQLKVVATLKEAGKVVEEVDTVMDFLPGRSSREGGVFFQRDPRLLQLELQARSYIRP